MILSSLLVTDVSWTSPKCTDLLDRATSIPFDWPISESLSSLPPTTFTLNYVLVNYPTIVGEYVTVMLWEAPGIIHPSLTLSENALSLPSSLISQIENWAFT